MLDLVTVIIKKYLTELFQPYFFHIQRGEHRCNKWAIKATTREHTCGQSKQDNYGRTCTWAIKAGELWRNMHVGSQSRTTMREHACG